MRVSQLKDAILMGFHQLALNRFRSGLAIMGISIGIAALVAVESIGEGTKLRLIQQMEELGGAEVIKLEMEPNEKMGKASEFTSHEIGSLAKSLTQVESLAPSAYGGYRTVQRDKGLKLMAPIYGTTQEFYRTRNLELDFGRFIWDRDEQSLNKVCVLGYQVSRRLFGAHNPIGHDVRLGDDTYFVVGSLKEAKFHDLTYGVFVPLSTIKKRRGEIIRTRDIYLKVSSIDNIQPTISRLEWLFPRLLPGKKILIKDRLLAVQTVQKSSDMLRLFLIGVGCITLVVGGLGIMNVMLVNITERTTEIGIRKAVGARDSDILRQFLIETIILSLPGGLIGLAGGYIASISIAGLISRFLQMYIRSEFSLVAVLIAVSFSLAVGFIFGLFPAMKAARKNIVSSLRYE
jgi:putative ABC transport system permease protein